MNSYSRVGQGFNEEQINRVFEVIGNMVIYVVRNAQDFDSDTLKQIVNRFREIPIQACHDTLRNKRDSIVNEIESTYESNRDLKTG